MLFYVFQITNPSLHLPSLLVKLQEARSLFIVNVLNFYYLILYFFECYRKRFDARKVSVGVRYFFLNETGVTAFAMDSWGGFLVTGSIS